MVVMATTVTIPSGGTPITLQRLVAAAKELGYRVVAPERLDTRTDVLWASSLVARLALWAEDMPEEYRGRKNRTAIMADLAADFPWDHRRHTVAKLMRVHKVWPAVAARWKATQGWSIDRYVREMERANQ